MLSFLSFPFIYLFVHRIDTLNNSSYPHSLLHFEILHSDKRLRQTETFFDPKPKYRKFHRYCIFDSGPYGTVRLHSDPVCFLRFIGYCWQQYYYRIKQPEYAFNRR